MRSRDSKISGSLALRADTGRNRAVRPGSFSGKEPVPMTSESAAAEPVRLALRKLWSDHVIWTLEYIIAATAGPHGLTDVAEHLPLGSAGAGVASTAQAALGAVPASHADAAAAR